MLVAMSKLVKRGLEPFNFQMVWNEYSIYAKNDMSHSFSKPVCLQVCSCVLLDPLSDFDIIFSLTGIRESHRAGICHLPWFIQCHTKRISKRTADGLSITDRGQLQGRKSRMYDQLTTMG